MVSQILTLFCKHGQTSQAKRMTLEVRVKLEDCDRHFTGKVLNTNNYLSTAVVQSQSCVADDLNDSSSTRNEISLFLYLSPCPSY